AAPPASGTTVDLKVESSTDPVPLFAGPVDTAPHAVDGGDGSGPHPCAGAPGATPVPTATGALDDGLRAAGISWQGNWNPSFRDFFIERIGPHASTPPDDYWSLSVNGRFSSGGCLAQISDGDEVRFFYGPLFGAPPELSPTGAAGGASEGQGTGGGRAGTDAARKPAELRRLARGASRFLRHNDGPGSEWAELALALRGGQDPAGDAQLLAERLLDRFPSSASPDEVDSVAINAWALAVSGRYTAARRAANTVRAAQAPEGGFPVVRGGSPNAQSTGVALIALRVAGLGPRPSVSPGGPTPLDYLASLARRNGSIAYARGSALTPVWTTAQALLGLTSRVRLLDLDIAAAAG
ncbi:MAG: hypothetical protein ABW196_08650, partial [Solirubrobacterales bacterium]